MPNKKETSNVVSRSGVNDLSEQSESKDLKNKKVVKNVTEKKVKPISSEKLAVKTPRNDSNLSVPLFSIEGKETGSLDLPKEIFGAKVNKQLLAQAIRVYTTNLKDFTGSTKTRGEVNMTTAKWFRQKGTGRARHGAQSAPIFVGGGVAFGPKFRKVRLDLPKKMRKAALVAALSDKTLTERIVGITGLAKALGKTKQMAQLMNQISALKTPEKKDPTSRVSILVVTVDKDGAMLKGLRNLTKVTTMAVDQLNAYEVQRHSIIVMTKDAVNFWSSK